MRHIAIVGGGQAGLPLALGLLAKGYRVTVVTNRSPQDIREGNVLSSQCMFDTALQVERDLGLNQWEAQCPPVQAIGLAITNPKGGGKLADWSARLDLPAQAVDQRIKIPAWMELLEARGGRLLIQDSGVAELELLAATHDLVVLAAGKGEVVKLFERAATPIQLTSHDAAYPITPTPLATGIPLSVYSVEAVYLGERTKSGEDNAAIASHAAPRTQVWPYRAFSHARPMDSSAIYWLAHRDPDAMPDGALAESQLALVNLEGQTIHPPYFQVDVDVLATNGEMPSRLPIGAPDSDLLYEGSALACPITLLSRPTLPTTLPRGGALWRVLATLAPHPLDLTRTGLPALKEFLRFHAPRSSVVAQRWIDAIISVDYKPAIRWMSLDNQFPSFVRGVEILLSFSETATRDVSLHRFSAVMDRFFGPYAQSNSYVQLVVLSAESGKELLRCTPRPGTQPLV
ncbi:type VI secretion system baseplate subunit TssF [Burkholderia vietnamiensis]|uniref:type VI secretion system baseplate subunit TssF n=1 Tax=Burkholderia vietnamiensis TaxID=60552 RepID=UPI001FC824AA|nr:type VI secretion system baseplate subunit TssF [Burkholderia vietnamiensis]